MRRLLLSLLLLPSAVFAATPLSGWSHVVTVTIDATLVDEAIPVIPVFLSEGDTAFWTAINAGTDIRVTEGDGSTVLDHYLVPTLTDSGTTGTACILVNVSSIISTSVDVEFWIHVGNGGASSTSNGSDVFAGTGITAFYMPGVTTDDIAGNGYNLTAVNAPTTAASDFEGVPAAVYNGTTQYHYSAGSPVATWPLTLEVIASPDSTTNTGNVFNLSAETSASPIAVLQLDGNEIGDPLDGVFRGASGSVSAARTSTGYSVGSYSHAAITRNANTGTSYAYIDGGSTGSNSTTLTTSAFDRISVGALDTNGSVSGYFDGNVAWCALHSLARSADYVSTSNNAWTNAGFLTFGPTVGTTDTGWQLFTSASTVTPGNTTWTNASNALTDDSNYASANIPDGDTSYTLKLTGADLSAIPSDATIAGWEYRIAKTGEDGGSEEIIDQTVQPIIAGTQSGTNVASASAWSDASIQTTDYGSDSQLYGLTPTVANMKDSGTGLAIQAYSQGGSTAEARIYTAWIRVHWTPAAPTYSAADKARGFLGVGP